MAQYIVAPAAERDIEAILAWSEEQFGEQARLRYEALLVRSILDVADNPKRPGSHHQPSIAETAWTYHLRHSRDHLDLAAARVRRRRHFLLYRVRADGLVEIGRVLHDSMELRRHLPDDYQFP